MISSASVAYLKAFNEIQTVHFASGNDADASKLTLVVGPNNSGKSSLINIIDDIVHSRDNTFTASKEHRHQEHAPSVKVRFGSHEITLSEGTGSQYKVVGLSQAISKQVKYVPSRRPWAETFSEQLNDEHYASNYRSNRRTNQSWIDSLFAGALGKLSTDLERKEEFDKLLSAIDPDIQNWRPEHYGNQYFIEYQARNGLWHRIGDIGDGVGSLFRICFELLHLKDSETLLVDEPELSLHPQVQRRLASAMFAKSYSSQIIIATHSPHFITWKALKAGAKVNRFNMTDRGCSISSLREATLGEIISVADTDRKNVMLYDTVAKEVFFSRGALFVEGAEDANILRSYVEQQEQPEIEIFGYGSGGHGNIAKWLRMCSELNIRGFGLYDGDADSSASHASATTTFANDPKIKVEKLPTPDIRDKWKADGTLDEEGAFDKDWKIKPQYQAVIDELLTAVQQHLGSSV